MNIIHVAVDLIQILITFLDTGINFLQGQITSRLYTEVEVYMGIWIPRAK